MDAMQTRDLLIQLDRIANQLERTANNIRDVGNAIAWLAIPFAIAIRLGWL